MKNYLIFFLVFVFGVVLGAWWPQSELSIAQSEIAELKKELASSSRKSLIPEMAKMIAMPDTLSSRPASKKKPKTVVKTPTPAPEFSGTGIQIKTRTFEDEDELGLEDEFALEMSRAFDGAESPEDALDTMADLWKTRRDMARDALADNLNLSDTELEDFDFAMDEMNNSLADQFEGIMDTMAGMMDQDEPTPEDAFRIAHAFTGVFVDTYDDLDNTLPDGWREDSNSPVDLTAFIDPYVFKPMLELDDEWR